jgi:hypothetical protein
MSIVELEIGWAETAGERRYLYWELLACDDVRGVFLTVRDDVLAVLFSGGRDRFHVWARSLAPEAASLRTTPLRTTAATKPKGALQ